MIIKMKLKDVIHDDALLRQTGLNPYCCNEGANSDDYIEVQVKDIIPYSDEELEKIMENINEYI